MTALSSSLQKAIAKLVKQCVKVEDGSGRRWDYIGLRGLRVELATFAQSVETKAYDHVGHGHDIQRNIGVPVS